MIGLVVFGCRRTCPPDRQTDQEHTRERFPHDLTSLHHRAMDRRIDPDAALSRLADGVGRQRYALFPFDATRLADPTRTTRAGEGNRTPDLLLTMEALCRLSYSGGRADDNNGILAARGSMER